MTTINLLQIKDGGAQMRVEMRPETIDEYAAEMLDGAIFPPVIVFFDRFTAANQCVRRSNVTKSSQRPPSTMLE